MKLRGKAAARAYGPPHLRLETRQTRDGRRQVWVATMAMVDYVGVARSRLGAIADLRPVEERHAT